MNTSAYYNSQPVDNYIKELSLREREVTRSRGIDNFKKEVPYKILLFLGYVAGICLLIWFLFNGLKNLLVRYNVIQEIPYTQSTIVTAPYEPQSTAEDRLIDMEQFLPNSSDSGGGSGYHQGSNNGSGPNNNGSGSIGSSPSQSSSEIERPIKNTRSSGDGSSSGGGSGSSGSSDSSSDQNMTCSLEEGSASDGTIESNGSATSSTEVQSENQNASEPKPIDVAKPKRGAVRDYVIFDTTLFDGEYISELTVGRRYENQESESNSQWCYTELMYASGLVKTLYLVSTNKNGILEPTEITHEIANKFGVPISEIHRAQRSCSI